MSDLTSSDIQALDSNYYIVLASTTFLLHEYCLTFTLEVERFWSSQRLTWAVFFFFLNRYLTLFGNMPVVMEFFWSSVSNKTMICRILQSYNQFFAAAVAVVVCVLLIVRTYALFEHSRRVLVLLLGVALIAAGVACWCLVSGERINASARTYSVLGCLSPTPQAMALGYARAWSGLLVFDTLVFGLTAYKSLVQHRRTGWSLLTLMLRDGAIYFSIMITLNTANILTFVYGGLPTWQPFTRGLLTGFMNISSSVMITRLMLNLRDPSFTAMSQHSRLSTLAFNNQQGFSTLADSGGGMEFTGQQAQAQAFMTQ